MNNVNSLSNTKRECKYHMVWIPEYRRKSINSQLCQHLGEVFHDITRQKENKVLEWHLQQDHVHMMIAIPPKYSVSQVVGYIKKEKCNPHCSRLPWPKKEPQRDAFLGTRIF